MLSKAKNAKDIEDYFCSPNKCKLCLPESTTFHGVLVFPHKVKKTKISEKTSVVCILKHQQDGTVCLIQRPETGLLANLYEFPSIEDMSETENAKEIEAQLKHKFSAEVGSVPKYHGEIVHKFSHITQKYLIWSTTVTSKTSIAVPAKFQKLAWPSNESVLDGTLAISTAMKKVYRFYMSTEKNEGNSNTNKKRKVMSETKQQPSILSFFNKK